MVAQATEPRAGLTVWGMVALATTIKIDWHEIDDLAKDLGSLPQTIGKAVQKAQEDDFEDVAKELAKYPPQLPGTKYIRTNRLKKGWLNSRPRINILGSGANFTAELSNPVEYSGEVQGGAEDNPHQTNDMRRRRWKTTDQVLKETEPKAQKRLDDAVQQALDQQLGK